MEPEITASSVFVLRSLIMLIISVA